MWKCLFLLHLEHLQVSFLSMKQTKTNLKNEENVGAFSGAFTLPELTQADIFLNLFSLNTPNRAVAVWKQGEAAVGDTMRDKACCESCRYWAQTKIKWLWCLSQLPSTEATSLLSLSCLFPAITLLTFFLPFPHRFFFFLFYIISSVSYLTFCLFNLCNVSPLIWL